MTEPDKSASASDHAYFQALEGEFIRLRGAPLLLSPADWQIAKRWRREGIPLELVVRVMERVFERRADAQKKAGIRSLSYFASAVTRSWQRIVALGGGDRPRANVELTDIPTRLDRLAAALSGSEDGGAFSERSSRLRTAADAARAEIAARIERLRGTAEEIEGELQRLDRELLDRLLESVDEETLARLEEGIRDSLGALAPRLGARAREQTREILLRRRLREEAGLPVLSLFSPEAGSRRSRDSVGEREG